MSIHSDFWHKAENAKKQSKNKKLNKMQKLTGAYCLIFCRAPDTIKALE